MEKVNLSSVLKTVFNDISDINIILQNSKAVEESCKEINFNDQEEARKILEATQNILKTLEDAAAKVSGYFNENYSNWKIHTLEFNSGQSESTQNHISENVPHAEEKDTDISYPKENTACNLEDQNAPAENNEMECNQILDKNTTEISDIDQNVNVTSDEAKSLNHNEFPNTTEDDKVVSNVTSDDTTPSNECNATVVQNGDPIETIQDNLISDKEISNENNDPEVPKVFLKCVDIKKLVKPDILPHLRSPSPTKDAINDSILIISDSEEDHTKSTLKKNKGKLKGKIVTFKENKQTSLKILNYSVINKKSDGLGNTDNSKPSSSNVRVYPASKISKNINKSDITNKNYDTTDSSSSSSSSLSDSNELLPSTKRNLKRKCVKLKSDENVEVQEIDKNDKKIYKAYVPLPRIPSEKLLENYLKQKEMKEVKSLLNLKTLNKRTYTTDTTDESLSPDLDNQRRKNLKRRKRVSFNDINSKHSSSSISVNDSSSSSNNDETPEVLPNVIAPEPIAEVASNNLDNDTVQTLLDEVNVESDHSANKSDKGDSSESEKGKKTKNSSTAVNDKCDVNPESEKKDTVKSSWHNDSLLKAKISESESEDDSLTFKKNRKNTGGTIKSRLQKNRKTLLGSDSESENENKKDSYNNKTQKDRTSSESDSDKDEDSSSKEQSKTKKRRRIKRIDESSDEDKTTRKTIRKVIAHDSLAETTKLAEKDEKERKMRILERQKKYNQIFESDRPSDVVLDKIVLDFNEETLEELVAVHKDLVQKLKPHQAKGVQFMWNACFESLQRTKSTTGSGCVLAHCMGLGKTLQVITLIHTLLSNKEKTGIKTVLVVCPVNTGLNWVDEFDKWLEDIEGITIDVYDVISVKQNGERQYRVKEWSKNGGVMVIGYDMYRNLTNANNKRLRKSQREIFQKGLVNPGPDLIICDEGHLLKNEKTNLSIAMNRVNTQRRIMLTGTPMQNNLKEYYCMVQFVKPNLLGTYKEYLNRFVNPITNGQYTDSTPHDINIMRKRSHVLHKMLDGIVQRNDYSVLTPYLPPKYDYVLFIKLSEVQIKLYQHYLDNLSRKPSMQRTSFLFSDFQEFQRICTHPRVLLNKSLEMKRKEMWNDNSEEEDSEGSLKDFINDESDESSSDSSGSSSGSSNSNSRDKHKPKSNQRLTRNSAAAAGIDIQDEVLSLNPNEPTEWWRQYCDGEELDNIANSRKLDLLFEILQQCELIGDKLLVFSQSLYSLDVIQYFLEKIDEATQNGKNVCGFSGSWVLGLDYFRLDGSSSCDNRAIWCKNFNNPENIRARLFLISTRAGGLGINLTAANRVIIFDVSWNPSHDIQSIYRIYRFGQTKPCYIYRFVTWGSMEMKVYERQITKQAISKRVIDEQQIDRHYNQNDLAELYKFDPEPTEPPTPLVPKDVLLGELLQREKHKIYKYHEQQSLLENKKDEELNEEERKAAWEEFENEKVARVNTTSAAGWIRNIPLTTITAAVYNLIQKDNPSWREEQVQSVVPLVIQQLREQLDAGNNMLMTRISTELQIMHAQQQQKLREYYMQQQQLRLFQQNRQLLNNMTAEKRRNNPNTTRSSNDVIEINEV